MDKHTDDQPFQVDLAIIKKMAKKMATMLHGYRFEVDPDGTERMIRPDGSVAVTARPPKSVR